MPIENLDAAESRSCNKLITQKAVLKKEAHTKALAFPQCLCSFLNAYVHYLLL